MRHAIAGTKLNRDLDHRKALLKVQAKQLISLGVMQTTATKARILVGTVEKLLTMARQDTVHTKRQLFAVLGDSTIVKKTCELAQACGSRSGGFVKLIRVGTRRGDNTMMVRLELIPQVSKPEIADKKATPKEKKTTKPKKETVQKTAKKTISNKKKTDK